MRLLLITMMLVFGSLFTTSTANAQRNIVTSVKKGIASFYHDKFVGRKTSTGEVFSNNKFTAASNTLKLGTYAKVTNLKNGRYVYVKINDRMAKTNSRLIDLTKIAATRLNFTNQGLTQVKVEPVSPAVGKRGIIAQSGTTVNRNIL